MNPIETSRLRLREFIQADLEAVARVLDACFEPSPREARKSWLDWTIRNYRELESLHQPPYGDYAIVLKDDSVIGSVGLVPCCAPFNKLPIFRQRLRAESNDYFTPEMGLYWAIAPEHRGRGYATEAAAAMVRIAFDALRVERIVATTEHANAASIGVMQRIGMQIERNPDPAPPWFQTVGVLFQETSRMKQPS